MFGDDGDVPEIPAVKEMTCDKCSADIEVVAPGDWTAYEVECFRCNGIAKTIMRLDPQRKSAFTQRAHGSIMDSLPRCCTSVRRVTASCTKTAATAGLETSHSRLDELRILAVGDLVHAMCSRRRSLLESLSD